MRHIWRIKNLNTKGYTFLQQHCSSYIQRRLDYFFTSNVLQESEKNPDVLAAFSTDHLPIIFSLFSKSEGTRGKGLWKHNNSLCDKSTYINSMNKHISTLENLNNENITDEQSVWEHLKYKIRKISKTFSKEAARSKKIESSALNDGITKEFYEEFWDDLKTPLISSVNKAFKVGELITSQKQAVIKLIEKKDKDKRLIKKIGDLFLSSTLTQYWFQKLY